MEQPPNMTDPTSGPPSGSGPVPAAKRRRWMAWALGISLCVNLVLLGAAAGIALRGDPRRLPPPGGAGLDPFTLHRMMERLPEEQRREAWRLLRRHKPDFDQTRAARAEARRALAAAIAAEPFDRGALETAMAASRGLEAEGRRILDGAFVEFVSTLAAPIRAELAEEMLTRRGPDHDRDGRPPKERRPDRDGDGPRPPKD